MFPGVITNVDENESLSWLECNYCGCDTLERTHE